MGPETEAETGAQTGAQTGADATAQTPVTAKAGRTKRRLPPAIPIAPRAHQCLWEARGDVYEVAHSVPTAPWIPHAVTRLNAPDHIRALHAAELARHQPRRLSHPDGELTLETRIHAIRVGTRPGLHEVTIWVGHYLGDACIGGEAYAPALGHEHPFHAAHDEHLATHEQGLQVQLPDLARPHLMKARRLRRRKDGTNVS